MPKRHVRTKKTQIVTGYKNKVLYDALTFLAAQDVCEELKDGQWPDPSDCKAYYLCRGVGTPWGEQKREVCYTGKKKNSYVINLIND